MNRTASDLVLSKPSYDGMPVSFRNTTLEPLVMKPQTSSTPGSLPSPSSSESPSSTRQLVQLDDSSSKPSKDNCERRDHDGHDASRLPNVSQQQMIKSVTPYLREHIPGLYAPVGNADNLALAAGSRNKDPNSRFCYRHRPDSKCRRAADESKMALIQSVRLVSVPDSFQRLTNDP